MALRVAGTGRVVSAMEKPAPPGWYHLDAHTIRYWNGETWVGDSRPVPRERGRPLPYDRSPKKRNWWGIALLVLVGISVLGGVAEGLERRTTDLGEGREGTQQEWIDYFDSVDASVDTINRQLSGTATTVSLARIVTALKQLGDSPDEVLNRSVGEAVDACESADAVGCVRTLSRVADEYNAALQSAEKQGLIMVKDE